MVPLHLVMWCVCVSVCARVILYATVCVSVCVCVCVCVSLVVHAAWSHENGANEGLLFIAGTSGQTSTTHTARD